MLPKPCRAGDLRGRLRQQSQISGRRIAADLELEKAEAERTGVAR